MQRNRERATGAGFSWLTPWAGVLACLLILAGCNTRPVPAPVPPAPAPIAIAPAPLPAAPPAVETAPEEPVEATQPTDPPVSKERILLATPRGPLIIEFHLSIDGRPHVEALDRLVAEVLPLADTDGDGRPTWKEITTSKRFKHGQYGNLPVGGENDVKQVIERYDIDRDGLVDTNELPRFLTRNAGGSRAFSVRGSADFRLSGRRGSPLWKVLDTDDDGALSAAEIAAAPGRVLSRDLDDDEIVAASDLAPPANVFDPGMMSDRRRRGPEIVRLLGPHANWDSVRQLLEEHYGSPLSVESFPLMPGLFGKLDANQDGRLQKTELAGLNDATPQIVVAVEFGSPEGENAETPAGEAGQGPRLKLVAVSEALANSKTSAVKQGSRLMLDLAGTPLTFYRSDTLAAGNDAMQAEQLLMALDGDKNGYLEAKEVPENVGQQLGRFEAVDVDEDGKVFAAEIVTYLAQQQAGLRAQIHARASDGEDALFAALDQNRDQRLDAREIDGAPARLVALDQDADGQITTDELPESLTIGLARGSLENMDALFAPPPLTIAAPAGDAPRWFSAMDTNGDGVVSPREFIGPPEKFAPLDANRDGLVDLAEAKAVVGE